MNATQTGVICIANPAGIAEPDREASSDEDLINLWLGTYRSVHTVRAFRSDARAFLRATCKPLREVRLRDVQAFSESLAGLADATAARRLSAIKSLIGFGHRIGYLMFDTAAPVRLPPIKDRLAERIMSEWDMQQLLGLERRPRNAALLRLIYGAGLRISEVCGLRWRDFTPRDGDAGQVNVFGKGGKTRVILLPVPLWKRVIALRGEQGPDAPVFRSRKGGSLGPRGVHAIVKAAARRAKLPPEVSAHWLRHGHASHALDRGAPVHVVQTTLGHASLTTTTRYSHARPGDSSAKYLTA
jgi:integrase/recombinase XerD